MIFKLTLAIDAWGISCEIVLRCLPLDLTYDKSTLGRVMVAWCPQATSHYLIQCWPRSGLTQPHWVKLLLHFNTGLRMLSYVRNFFCCHFVYFVSFSSLTVNYFCVIFQSILCSGHLGGCVDRSDDMRYHVPHECLQWQDTAPGKVAGCEKNKT